ncbi:TIR domain protein [Helicobacter pylori]|uniref:toll/interleukin-1 receptor domain-containing protein n=1 Tax=Helicobacter pylori TaxID=210 RepID=UPI0011C91EE5|nr:toll/interleukin-1 receptor domain-containing protein [Helicobacter pylori]NHA47374.1 TIR domain protein [Helicobacter pylori]QEF39679.1 TIR domain protein [Helicobacter pylori]WRC48703.1 toll/interleukin-1 receptor domain-containing protein [Helicobacter pylori]WRE60058.1 toll/interleukin-1 receptor domain-containing protein [Helicobacter pylori]
MKAFVVDLDERENREVLCKFHFDRGGKSKLEYAYYDKQAVSNIHEVANKIKTLIQKSLKNNEYTLLNRNEIKEAFFSPFKPQLKTVQVFLSHSHADRNKALEVKNYLENQTKRKVFIDSLFWDYKDDVLNELADELAEYNDISRIEDTFTLILRESLQDMIEKCPYFVFLQSKNSVPNQGLSRITHSAWIYEELKIANTFITGTTLKESHIKAMRVSYDVTNLLRRFKPISLDSLCKKIAPNLITKDTK